MLISRSGILAQEAPALVYAIPTFQKLVGMDEAYRDGSVAYYLAQSFRKSGDLASAKPYYQYVVDNYAGTEKARTSKNYLAQEQ